MDFLRNLFGKKKDNEQEFQKLISKLQDGSEDAAKELGQLGDARAVEPLIAALKNERVCRDAAIALGQIGDARAVEPLIAVAEDWTKHYSVRIFVARALGQLGDNRAVDPLIAILKNGQEDSLREAAASALGRLGDARAVPPLLASIACLDHQLDNRTAPEALVQIGVAAVEPLIAVLTEQNVEIRRAAATALGQIGDTRAVEPLKAVLKKSFYWVPDDLRATFIRALNQLGSDGQPST